MNYRLVSSFVGVAESELGTVTGQTPLRMMASATLDALGEAGLTPTWTAVHRGHAELVTRP
jgi:hypothetical protein